jgi:hypothetical protein
MERSDFKTVPVGFVVESGLDGEPRSPLTDSLVESYR